MGIKNGSLTFELTGWMPQAASQSEERAMLNELLERFANDVCAMCHEGVGDGGEATKAAILAHAERTCEWGEEDDGLSEWETQCGNAFVLNDGSPKQNNMNFCPYCGGKLIERLGMGVRSDQ